MHVIEQQFVEVAAGQDNKKCYIRPDATGNSFKPDSVLYTRAKLHITHKWRITQKYPVSQLVHTVQEGLHRSALHFQDGLQNSHHPLKSAWVDLHS